jgi:hypothetical protein
MEKAAAARAEQEEALAEVLHNSATVRAAEQIEAAVRVEESKKRAQLVAAWDVQKDKRVRDTWDLEDPAFLRRQPLPRNPLPCYETHDMGHTSGVQTLAAELKEDPERKRAAQAAMRAGLDRGQREKELKRLSEQEEARATAWAQSTMAYAVKDIDDVVEGERRVQAVLVAKDNAMLVSF